MERDQYDGALGAAVITRRTLLARGARAGAGASAAAAFTGLPAWARIPVAGLASVRRPDSLPFPHLPAGHESLRQIRHVVVLMLENQSFDGLLGMVPHQVAGRSQVDGLAVRSGRVRNWNPDARGHRVYGSHFPTPCQLDRVPKQDWDASHTAWNHGRLDGFVRASGPTAMLYWDEQDLPVTYSLAQHFPIGQRYFCSTLAQTYPNRRFFFTGTASGTIATTRDTFSIPAANGTIWDRLDAHRVSWAVYSQGAPSPVIVPGTFTAARQLQFRKYAKFAADVRGGHLPQFTFLDPDYRVVSEENPQDVQFGERFVSDVVRTLMHGPQWESTALFITYDEHGGYYDHVPPPRALAPDSIRPRTKPGDAAGGYDRLGFRVPMIVVSPWARANYISPVVQDHTSLTAFLEHKWNLPAMTFRDANAAPMTDYFDLRRPAFAHPPRLAPAPPVGPGLARCRAHGFSPPLP